MQTIEIVKVLAQTSPTMPVAEALEAANQITGLPPVEAPAKDETPAPAKPAKKAAKKATPPVEPAKEEPKAVEEKPSPEATREILDKVKARREAKAAEAAKKETPAPPAEPAKEEPKAEAPVERNYSTAEVRTFATKLVKGSGDVTAGKKALAECLKAVGANSITASDKTGPGATQEQLNAIVPLIEEKLGQSLEEVLAETTN